MLNVLYKNIDWNNIENVGFDLDGTLYDEFNFIEQVYEKIAETYDYKIKDFMLQKWLEKGSSYPYIFKETYEHFSNELAEYNMEDFINSCVEIYRNFNPKLELPERTKQILKTLKRRYNLFLITDGNLTLQQNKVKSLNISEYIDEENIIFTSKSGLQKKDLKLSNILKNINPEKTVFLGDRDLDEEFATNSGIQFVKVYNMIGV